MNPASVSVSVRLQKATSELRDVEALLDSADLDPRILSDFRDAVNRVRNTAWAVEQYSRCATDESDPQTVVSLLAGERIRVAYQLCRLIQSDLGSTGIRFQKGQLLELRNATTELQEQLGEAIKK